MPRLVLESNKSICWNVFMAKATLQSVFLL
jgi:hypothetical protein